LNRPASHPSPPQLPTGGKLYWLGLLGSFLIAFLFYHQPHDFPWFYHVDEAYKAQQVADRERGFTHPLLLLNLTQLVHNVWRGGDDIQIAAEAGRLVSAVSGAGCVAVAFAIGWLLAGAFGAYFAAIAVLLTPQLYLLSHFTKEDSVLALSWLTVGAMLYLLHRQRTQLDLIATGMACGLAVSSKYAGILLLPAAMATALGGRWPKNLPWPRRLLTLLFFAAGTFVLANAPMLLEFSRSNDRILDELRHLSGGHSGIATAASPAYYGGVFYKFNGFWWTPATIVGLAFLITFRHTRLPTLAFVGSGLIYLFFLLISRKQAETYYLPLNLLIHLYGAIGAAWAIQFCLQKRASRWLGGTAAALLLLPPLASDIRRTSQQWHWFQNDSLAAFREYVATSLPPDARIVQDQRAHLPNPDDPRRRPWVPEEGRWPEIIDSRYAGDVGSLEELRARGVTHVAVSWTDYYRFVVPNAQPTAEAREEFEGLRTFYETLRNEGKLLWEAPLTGNMYLWPGVELYDIRRGEE